MCSDLSSVKVMLYELAGFGIPFLVLVVFGLDLSSVSSSYITCAFSF